MNILVDALKLPRMCLEVVFRLCVYCENIFYSSDNAITTGTLKCPCGMVRYCAVTFLKTSSFGRSSGAEYLPVIKRCGIESNGCEYPRSFTSVWYVGFYDFAVVGWCVGGSPAACAYESAELAGDGVCLGSWWP